MGRQGVFGRDDRAAGAGVEERALGAVRRSRGDSVSGGVSAVGGRVLCEESQFRI